jgi:hypothetical protein
LASGRAGRLTFASRQAYRLAFVRSVKPLTTEPPRRSSTHICWDSSRSLSAVRDDELTSEIETGAPLPRFRERDRTKGALVRVLNFFLASRNGCVAPLSRFRHVLTAEAIETRRKVALLTRQARELVEMV